VILSGLPGDCACAPPCGEERPLTFRTGTDQDVTRTDLVQCTRAASKILELGRLVRNGTSELFGSSKLES
jgi:hypothetical protein